MGCPAGPVQGQDHNSYVMSARFPALHCTALAAHVQTGRWLGIQPRRSSLQHLKTGTLLGTNNYASHRAVEGGTRRRKLHAVYRPYFRAGGVNTLGDLSPPPLGVSPPHSRFEGVNTLGNRPPPPQFRTTFPLLAHRGGGRSPARAPVVQASVALACTF